MVGKLDPSAKAIQFCVSGIQRKLLFGKRRRREREENAGNKAYAHNYETLGVVELFSQ